MYRASHVLGDLGWVDLDLGSSPGWWAANVATYCPSRVVEHSKSKSTKPSLRGHGTPCIVMVMQSGASGLGLGWVDLDLGCCTILLGQ